MAKRMLIDATHPEETRVAVVEGNRLEEFDYESILRKQLKGNIYLAKVTRVEPSLQAAFVNFGGNRHGFLPFSEIHPDYFRIPVEDREKLMAAQEEAIREQEEIENKIDEELEKAKIVDDKSDVNDTENNNKNKEELKAEDNSVEASEEKTKTKTKTKNAKNKEDQSDVIIEDEVKSEEIPLEIIDESDGNVKKASSEDIVEAISEDSLSSEDSVEATDESKVEETSEDSDGNNKPPRRNNKYKGRGRRRFNSKDNPDDSIKDNGKDDGTGRVKRFNIHQNYKIQEVVKRGQIMLIQVSKEERGNKGAAVTSYLSLPGRYCVLMPNSPRSGGISRKIDNYQDRKRMRDLLKDLDTPKGMSVIVRTAGVTRTKDEIKRDLNYLTRLWNDIRELTLGSSAPSTVYEEGSLTKRSIRDIYTKEVEDILVAGEDGYNEAKKIMTMLVPTHVKKVKLYKDDKIPLFHRYQVESQISEIGKMTVQLPSGGYLVINPTEALVAIDVNSGRATKGRHIEETALKTNLESAVEVARQLKLRDLGGLVVIDFIDMEDRRNNAKVERKMRDALSNERARVQVGRISPFGLMELSRQRLNPSLTEAQFEVCSHCKGAGTIRSIDSTAIQILRALEEEGIKSRSSEVMATSHPDVAIYVLNQKRSMLLDLESKHNMRVIISVDDKLNQDEYSVEVVKLVKDDVVVSSTAISASSSAAAISTSADKSEEDERKDKKGNRRRGKRGGKKKQFDNDQNADNSEKMIANEGDKSSDKVKEEENIVTKEQSSHTKTEVENPKKSPVKAKIEVAVSNKTTDDSTKEEIKVKPKAKPKPKPKPKTKAVAKKPKSDDKDPVEKEEKSSAVAPSNDDKKIEENLVARKAEKINEAPKAKKKGWWSL